ncbi:MAG: class I SAM-dependent methyltransferase [Acetobacteraceae bacterium]|jgi:SAM-dependent methyltransferase
MATLSAFSSGEYWEVRYRRGGTSGAGSVGRLARFKADVINRFIVANGIRSVIDLGCGDGSQLGLLGLPAEYVGVDVSPTALARCAERYPNLRFVTPEQLRTVPPAELTLSLDVIYHLVEGTVFTSTMRTLFAWATRFVLIYASDRDEVSPSAHVRHRRFTDLVTATEPDWRLVVKLPNPFPYDPRLPDETSFADFFVYGRRDAPCSIVVPAVA